MNKRQQNLAWHTLFQPPTNLWDILIRVTITILMILMMWWFSAYMQFTLSPRTYVKLSLKTNQASGSGVIGLNVERDKAREDQATFLL